MGRPVLFSGAAIRSAFGELVTEIHGQFYRPAACGPAEGRFDRCGDADGGRESGMWEWHARGAPGTVTRFVASVSKHLAKFQPADPVRCLRHHFAAGVVKQDALLLPSYNGAPRGSVNCDELGLCNKTLYKVPVGGGVVPHTGDEHCPAVHAEENVICAAARLGIALAGTDLFVTGIDPDGSRPDCLPCAGCAKLCRAVGFRLVVADGPRSVRVLTPGDLPIVRSVHPELLQVGAPAFW